MESKEYWSKLYGKPVSEAERQEIFSNLSGYFLTLKQWTDNEKNQNKEVISNEQNSNNHQ